VDIGGVHCLFLVEDDVVETVAIHRRLAGEKDQAVGMAQNDGVRQTHAECDAAGTGLKRFA
jgi:hypothetical protein